jgi:ABC-type phosphate/phosphonate transport system permease subunit
MSVAERTTSPLAHGLRQLAIGAVLLALFVASSIGSRASLDAMLDGRALGQALALLGGLLRPDLDAAFVARVAWLTAESLAIGAIGMAVALVLAIPLAVCAARVPGLRDTPSRAGVALVARGTLRWGARSVLSALRSIPEIIWAYLFVRILGLGAGPAVLAIGLSFAGIIGKLYAELIDACDPRPLRAKPRVRLACRSCCTASCPKSGSSGRATACSASSAPSAARRSWASWAPAVSAARSSSAFATFNTTSCRPRCWRCSRAWW